MANKVTDAMACHMVNLYLNGMNCQAVADAVGVSTMCAHKHISKAGVIRPLGSANARAGRERRARMAQSVVAAFKDGTSVLRIAGAMGVSRATVAAILRDGGLTPRDGSEASILRFQNTTPDERKLISAAANAARRGAPASDMEMARKAAWKEASLIKVGEGEAEMSNILAAAGFNPEPQRAIGRYNIDVLCGDVAVEIHSQNGFPHATPATRKRIEYLFDCGLNVIYVMAFSVNPRRFVDYSETASNDVIAFVQRTQSDPTFRRQYRVIRSSGEVVATAGNDLDNVTVKPMPRRRPHTS